MSSPTVTDLPEHSPADGGQKAIVFDDVALEFGGRPILRVWEEDDALQLEVAGVAASADLPESDLTELGDRVETLGGRLTIAPGPEGGTRLDASIPVAG